MCRGEVGDVDIVAHTGSVDGVVVVTKHLNAFSLAKSDLEDQRNQVSFGVVVFAEAKTGPTWAKANDQRVTRVGRVIRKIRVDELPQLVNVLRGDMSLVGPRPEQPKFVERFRSRYPAYSVRHRVRAGLTGWAQVNGLRGDTSIRQRIVHDLYYIENWSLGLDMRILWRTLRIAIHDAWA